MFSTSFDARKLLAHRIEQAEARWPLLRGCPSAAVIDRLTFLDSLTPDDALLLAHQMSELEARQQAHPPETEEERRAGVAQFPLLESYLEHYLANRPKVIGRIPVKILAGVQKDTAVGGIEGWAKMTGLTEAQLVLPAPHASSIEDLVPVKPARLRKLVAALCAGLLGAKEEKLGSDFSRFTGAIGVTKVSVTATFAQSGGRPAARQLDYTVLAQRPDMERPSRQTSYESYLRLPGTWDFLTEQNAEPSIRHLGTVIQACVDLI